MPFAYLYHYYLFCSHLNVPISNLWDDYCNPFRQSLIYLTFKVNKNMQSTKSEYVEIALAKSWYKFWELKAYRCLIILVSEIWLIRIFYIPMNISFRNDAYMFLLVNVSNLLLIGFYPTSIMSFYVTRTSRICRRVFYHVFACL